MAIRYIGLMFILMLHLTMISCSGSSSGQGGSNNTGPNTENPTPTDNPDDSSPPVSIIWDPADFSHVYDVGPEQPYTDPSQVPWESLEPSTLVRIYYRDTPYRTKFVITTTASSGAPLVVLGIPNGGRLPVISGDNATTRSGMSYLNEARSVVKVGNYTGSGDSDIPAHVYIQNFEIRSGRPGYRFADRHGDQQDYSNNAAAIHIEEGDHIIVAGCDLHDCGNGLFNSHFTYDILIRQNHIYDNGIEGSYYEHNSYTESHGIIFEYNHYGPLRAGCGGNNLKDRSCGTTIRYNWIEGGNRQLDLVETDYDTIYNDPSYDESFVYGNVLIEPEGAGNSQILHYGGDSGDTGMYRQGTLYFYHNTVVSTRSGNTTLLRLSTNIVNAQVNNNILLATAGGRYMAITSGSGQTIMENNWIGSGWRDTHESSLDNGASVSDLGNHEGTTPGFENQNSQDFHLDAAAGCVNEGGVLPGATDRFPVDQQYVKHQQGATRASDGSPDIGAFER